MSLTLTRLYRRYPYLLRYRLFVSKPMINIHNWIVHGEISVVVIGRLLLLSFIYLFIYLFGGGEACGENSEC